MKVKELINKLNKLDPESQVILQKDSEGNGYSPCYGVEAAVYIAESSYSGSVYSLKFTAEDNCMEEDEWERLKRNKKNKCVVIFPVN